jgi:outer membrane protein assembly factor BamB
MSKPTRSRPVALAAVQAVLISSVLGAGGLQAADVSARDQARQILSRIGTDRGICVLLGREPAELAVALARQSELTVYLQLPSHQAVQAARERAHTAGMLGSRICVEKGPHSRIYLPDNLADAVVVASGTARSDRVNRAELLRVVNPLGKVLLGATELTKPFPAGTDDWSHPYHGPDNNPQSADRLARAPYLTQFLAEPWYCPMPEVTVASGGRVFKAFGNRAFKRPQWPMLNTLIAVNGYNGTILWKRKLDADFMIHRNTMIATPDTLYLADAASCKLFDAASGELKGEIKVPEGISDGPVWKWMVLKEGTLYALVGEQEPPGDKLKGPAFRGAGWPWWTIPKYAWGFGRTILAIDPNTKRVLWHHRESEPLDTRAMCMKGDRIYFYSHRKFIGCLDAGEGKVLWKSEDSQALDAIGQQRPAQRAVWGFATTAFAKCSDEAIYFAGPQQTKLVAVSAADGKLLWQYEDEGNFQLVLRDEGLYAMGSSHPSRKFDPLTGKTLLRLPNRAACTRATGSVDRVFVRGGGTRSWDVAAGQWFHISPMRPACHDGVVVAGGQLYWGPWMCGCNLSLIGIISLGPAGDFDFSMKATEAERLELARDDPTKIAPLAQTADDWPTYRKDNARSACCGQTVAPAVEVRWQFEPGAPNTPSAPVTAGGLVFVGGSDGVLSALDAADGKPRWQAYTGGAIRYPPAIAEGRALVGSADGWIYAFEATSGDLLWRFRAAPAERKIPVYGSLSSTWPVGGGVLVEDGTLYAAAGIANYDGTHVYALDAATGKIRWQNNTSGNTTGGQGAGVSVQGHLLLDNGKLYLAGGNRVPLASYDVDDGQFRPVPHARFGADRRGPRGKDLFLRRDGSVTVTGMFPLHARPADVHFIESAELTSPAGTISVGTRGLGFVPQRRDGPARPASGWRSRPFVEIVAVAAARNAVLVVGTDRRFEEPEGPAVEAYGIAALSITDGERLWRHRLPAAPVSWGLAVDRTGRILVTLQDGRVLCFGPRG